MNYDIDDSFVTEDRLAKDGLITGQVSVVAGLPTKALKHKKNYANK